MSLPSGHMSEKPWPFKMITCAPAPWRCAFLYVPTGNCEMCADMTLLPISSLPSGTSVCKLRLAVNRRYKDQASGEWVEKPNYFDIKVWGAQGENWANYLAKGR